jgi:replicative DNA helicase
MNLPQILSASELDESRAAPGPAWPTPAPLGSPTPPGLDLAAAIPLRLGTFRAFGDGLAEALQVPPDAVFSLAVSIASGCAARAVETRAGPDWIETAPLWVCVLMQSAERKSALLTALSRPVFEWQRGEASLLGPDLAAYAENRRCLDAELANARGKYAKTKPGTPARQEAQAAVREIAETLDAMPPLCAPVILTADSTPEALRELLAANGEKALWVSAEADAATLSGTRYGKASTPNLNLLLAAKSGDPCPGQRIGRDISLNGPAVAIALAVQPAAISEIITDAHAREKGFVPRFAFVCPASRLGFRALHPPSLDPALDEWWAETLSRLLSLPWPGRVVTEGGELQRHSGPPRVLPLASDAVALLDPFRADLERRLGPGGDLQPCQAYASKLPGEVVRIAAILELLADANADTVRADTIRAALVWGAFLLTHYRHTLGEASATVATKHARRLLDNLRRRNMRTFSQREAQQMLDLDRDETETAIAILDDEGWTRELVAVDYGRTAEQIARGGRPPGPRREVNPAAFE